MGRWIATITMLLSMALSARAMATSYKCYSKDLESQERPHEIEVSFSPIHFSLKTFFRDEDGNWTEMAEILANETAVLEPIRISWADAEIKSSSDPRTLGFSWTYKSAGAGRLRLDLGSMAGEFYSSYQLGGNVYRLVKFYGCKEMN